VAAAVSVGAWREFARVHDAITERRRLWPWNIYRFQRTGHIWSGDAAPVSEWADDAKVCTCTGVTRGQLGAAIARGDTTVEGLARRTGASTVCGSCAPLLAELVGGTSEEAAGRQPGLLIASIIAAIMIAFVASAGPLRDPDMLQTVRSALVLSRDRVSPEISGFTLVGLAVVGLLASLRKRWKSFTAGTVSAWRLVHAAVGVATLAVLLVHTELRLGVNLNFALMVSFLGTAVTGAMAGIVVAFAGISKPRSRAIRYFFIGMHIVLFSALPALVVLHVVAIYYFSGR
jgi:nitrite reductase (NADH) large subunit